MPQPGSGCAAERVIAWEARHDPELPRQPDHEHLEGNHQQHRVEIIEDGQDTGFAKQPGGAQTSCRQHGKQHTH